MDIQEGRKKALEGFARILDIMDKLRDKCPWNAAQTMESLRPMTVEEVYELSDAIMKKDDKDLAKELGDVLFHVVFYSKIASEQGKFDIADVLDKVCEKMVYRHPHVFSDVKVSDAEQVSENWEMLKTKEKDGNARVLSGVPDAMPPVLKALAMQDKARGVGFDWEERSQVWDKVKEEQAEFQAELQGLDNEEDCVDAEFRRARAEEELGDYLFSIINAARLYGLNPDTALNRTCDKFRRRFTYIEENTIRKGRSLSELSLEEMDKLWDEAKSKEHN